jgi:hypothetical protein
MEQFIDFLEARVIGGRLINISRFAINKSTKVSDSL